MLNRFRQLIAPNQGSNPPTMTDASITTVSQVELQAPPQPRRIGTAAGIALEPLLKMFNLERSDRELAIVSRDRRGRISIQQGELIDAECEGVLGEPAVYRLLTWPRPLVEFRELPPNRPKRIDVPLAILLMESVLTSAQAHGADHFDMLAAATLDWHESRGIVAGLGLSTILSVLSQEQASVALEVTSGNRKGYVYLRDGELIDAICDDLSGEKAFLRLLGWSTDSVGFSALPSSLLRRIEAPLAILLLESADREDDVVVQSSQPVDRVNAGGAGQRPQYDFVTWQPLDMVLATLHKEVSNCILHVVSAEAEGWIIVEHGNTVEATCEHLTGEQAAYEMLSWLDSRIEISTRQPSSARPPAAAAVLISPSIAITEQENASDSEGQDFHVDEFLVPESAIAPNTFEEAPIAVESRPDVVLEAPGEALEATKFEEQPDPITPVEEPILTQVSDVPALEVVEESPIVDDLDFDTEAVLAETQMIAGYRAAAILDGRLPRVVGSHTIDTLVSFEGNAMPLVEYLGIGQGEWLGTTREESFEEAVITLKEQYHLINVIDRDRSTFLYLILDRTTANLAIARRRVAEICVQ